MKTLNTQKLIEFFASLKKDCIFLGIKGYVSSDGTVMDDTIAFHVSYPNAVKKSKKIISKLDITDELVKTSSFKKEDLERAKGDLLDSFNLSLIKFGMEDKETPYNDVLDLNGNKVIGLKSLKKDESIHLTGKLINRKIKKSSDKPNKSHKSRTTTLAKDFLKNKTPLVKFQNYKLVLGSFQEIHAQGKVLRHDDLVEEASSQLIKQEPSENKDIAVKLGAYPTSPKFIIEGKPGPEVGYLSFEEAQNEITRLCKEHNCPETDFNIKKI